MENNKLVYWFVSGKLHSGHVIGSMCMSFKAQNTDYLKSRFNSYRSILSRPSEEVGFDITLDTIMNLDWNNRKILMVSGDQMVPEDVTSSTKEDAFKKYTERLALDNGLMV